MNNTGGQYEGEPNSPYIFTGTYPKHKDMTSSQGIMPQPSPRGQHIAWTGETKSTEGKGNEGAL